MPKIIIKNMFDLDVETAGPGKTVLTVLQENGIDWMHACGGKGRCTTCKMTVLSGIDNLLEPGVHEQRFGQLGLLRKNERLSCQAKLQQGTVEIEVPDTSKLPHINYSY